MLIHAIFFYFFSTIAIFSSLMVITSRNTVNSVFFLILDFISVGCLFIMVGAEFLGMIILIVYVGAVAVLFLFVVMMLNVSEQKQSWFIGKKSTHIPTGLIVSVLIFLELLVVVGGWKQKDNVMSSGTLTISEVQGETNSSPYAGQVVTSSGIVTGRAENGFFIQDEFGPWNGIWIVDFGNASVSVGDDVEVTGLVEEYYDLTEIVIADGGSYNVLSNGNSLFNSININQGEEQYESVLVTISGTCDGPPNEYGEWTLSGNMVDDLMYSFTPVTGQEYTITGPLSYSFGNFRVLPRESSDIIAR